MIAAFTPYVGTVAERRLAHRRLRETERRGMTNYVLSGVLLILIVTTLVLLRRYDRRRQQSGERRGQ
jgi:hypothetical protein